MVDPMKAMFENTGEVIAEHPVKAKPDSTSAKKIPAALPGPKWYELDALFPYRDLLMVIGYIMVVGGIGMWSIPAALIFGGLGMIAASWLMSR